MRPGRRPRTPPPPDPSQSGERVPREGADGTAWPGPISRRTALTGGALLAAGAGVGVVGALASNGSAMAAGEFGVSVRDHGAAGDGKADDTDKIQEAIDAVRATGGIVFFPPGTYLTGRLTLYSRVHLRGSGGDATILKLRPQANSAIIESDGFDRLTGTRADDGSTLFSVRDLTLDGNQEQNPDGGYGLRLYGFGYELSDLIVFNCRNDGIYSEWGTAGALPGPSHQMEARLSGIRSHDNDGCGINFTGPHDSMFLNCLAFQNRSAGFRFGGDSHGTLMANCHAWGIKQNLAFDLAAPGISGMNCFADLDGGVGVRISRNDCRWLGGLVLGHNHDQPNREIGVQFAPGPLPGEPAGSVVDTKIINCGTAAVDFDADRGLSVVRATLSQPGVSDDAGIAKAGTGRGWIGRPAPTTQVEITHGLGNIEHNLVVRPAFDLRAQPVPTRPDSGSVRIFARETDGRTQLCALFPSGAVQVLAAEP